MKPASLLKNTLTYGLGQILSRGLSFILLPLFTGYLTVEDYGIISLLNMGAVFASSFLTLGLGGAFGICFCNSPEDGKKIISTSFWMIAAFSCLFLISTWPIAPSISTYFFHHDSYTKIIRLTLITTVALSLLTPFALYLQFCHKASLISKITVTFTLTSLLLNSLGIAFLDMGVLGQAIATCLSSISLLVMYWFPSRSCLTFGICRQSAISLLKFGLPMIPACLALFFLQNGQRYFLDRFSSLTEVGLFGLAYSFAMTANYLVSAFTLAWTPFSLEYYSRQEEAKTVFSQIFIHYTHLCGIAALCFFLFAHPVVHLMTKPPFFPAADAIGILSLGWLLGGYYNLLNVGIVFAKKVHFNTIIQLGACFVALLGNWLLIPHYGAMGASFAFLISQLFMVLAQELCTLSFGFFHPKIKWNTLLFWVTLFTLMIVFGCRLTFSSLLQEIFWKILILFCCCCLSCFHLTSKKQEAFFLYRT